MSSEPWQELDSEVGIIWHYARNSECRRTTVLGSSPVSIKVSGTLNMISRYIYIWCPHEFLAVCLCASCVPVSSPVISLHISDPGHMAQVLLSNLAWRTLMHKMTITGVLNFNINNWQQRRDHHSLVLGILSMFTIRNIWFFTQFLGKNKFFMLFLGPPFHCD